VYDISIPHSKTLLPRIGNCLGREYWRCRHYFRQLIHSEVGRRCVYGKGQKGLNDFIEDQTFSLSYYLVPPPPLLSRQQVFLCVASRPYWRERVGLSRSQITRWRESLVLVLIQYSLGKGIPPLIPAPTHYSTTFSCSNVEWRHFRFLFLFFISSMLVPPSLP
jgi:hypothetical protein